MNNLQAEFSYKLKPKLPAQFKAAESTGVPFAVILGEEELAAGEVRIKEMGLKEGHPEKGGVLVDFDTVAAEVRQRLDSRKKAEAEARDAELVTKVEELAVGGAMEEEKEDAAA